MSERIFKTIIAIVLVPFIMLLCALLFLLAVLLPIVAFIYPKSININS